MQLKFMFFEKINPLTLPLEWFHRIITFMDILVRPLRLESGLVLQALDTAPTLPSLRRLQEALQELFAVEWGEVNQIAEVIRRDPTLVARLFKWVNSPLFALDHPIASIEEAVLFLGLRQVKQLMFSTPILEDLQQCLGASENWKCLWRFALGSAIVTREALLLAGKDYLDETDYLLGLLHPIGHILIATLWPSHFEAIFQARSQSNTPLAEIERDALGMDHAQIGSYYLARHALGKEVVEGVQFHLNPILAPNYPQAAAAVELAHWVLQQAPGCDFEQNPPIDPELWPTQPSWDLLFKGAQRPANQLVADLCQSVRHWVDGFDFAS
jgi:HD-like signal output (HDOD) protein